MTLHETIKFLRRSSKLTQEQVASYIGVKRVAYTAYEAGRTSPSLENVVKLAKLYNVTTDTLLGCFTNAAVTMADFEDKYNSDRFGTKALTDEERELIAIYRTSDKKEAIENYIKRTLMNKNK